MTTPNPDTATRARYADLIEQLQSYSDRSCHAAATLIADLCDIIDQHTDPDLAARLLNMSKNGYDPHPHGVLRAAARKLGGEA